MTHVAGHVPNETLVILDYVLRLEFKVHGYLTLAKQKDDKYLKTDFRILFLDNHQLLLDKSGNIKDTYRPIPQAEWENYKPEEQEKITSERMVGFHLKLIKMPLENKFWGIAYDLVSWADHQSTEKCLQAIKRYKGKRVEDIDADELMVVADKLEKPVISDADLSTVLTDLKAKNVDKGNAINILRQSAEYMKSDSFKVTRAGDSPYEWINANVSKFDTLSKLFGEYARKKI